MSFENCYICDNKTMFFVKNMFMLNTKHSNTLIPEILQKFFNSNLQRTITNDTILCQECLTKIDEYDFAIETIGTLQKDLTNLLIKTNEKYNENCIFIKESHYDDATTVAANDKNDYNLLTDKIKSTKVVAGKEKIKSEQFKKTIQLKCKICNEQFSSISMMIKHKHSNNIIKKNRESLDKTTKTITEVKSKITKTIKLKSENAIQQRILHKCPKCPLEFLAKSEMKIHSKSHNSTYSCGICNIGFDDMEKLTTHTASHNNENPLKCPICDKIFTKKNTLYRHTQIHNGRSFFQCHKCGKDFIHSSSFKMHLMAHDDVREKKCAICNFHFRSTSHLNRHMRIHTGIKPFACPICKQKFAQRYNMTAHYKLLHQGIRRTVGKFYKCSLCNVTCKQLHKLQDHLKKIHDLVINDQFDMNKVMVIIKVPPICSSPPSPSAKLTMEPTVTDTMIENTTTATLDLMQTIMA